MGVILIIIGAIIQNALYKSNLNNFSEGYFENASGFMLNPLVRLILTLSSWVLIIYGLIKLFS